MFQISLDDFEDLYEDNNITFSSIGFSLTLKRRSTAFILQIYIPSSLFVMISWIGFLMLPGSGERGGMIVTILLVVVSMFLSVVDQVPPGKAVLASLGEITDVCTEFVSSQF